MAPRIDDFSDSDDEDGGVETSVLLGVPDGVVDDDKDLADAAVSRLGGLPVRQLSIHVYASSIVELMNHCNRRRRLSVENPHIHRRTARSATNLWSSSSRCGVRLRTVQWTGLSMSGVVLGTVVRAKMAGTSTISLSVPWCGERSLSEKRQIRPILFDCVYFFF